MLEEERLGREVLHTGNTFPRTRFLVENTFTYERTHSTVRQGTRFLVENTFHIKKTPKPKA